MRYPIHYHQTGRKNSPHLASKSQMAYAVECLEPKIFNWCAGFLTNVKDHISRCRSGRQETVWVWIFLGIILPRMNTLDATTYFFDRASGIRASDGEVD
jgi:hypothetical protein